MSGAATQVPDEPRKRYKVELKPSAAKALADLPTADRKRVAAKIDALADKPRPHGVVALQGSEGLLRIRSGSYRIIYRVEDAVLLVLVVRVSHRREAYR